jgi:UDP-N-acetylmuramoyl-tripeptide--D-alanyl-D-alanine ligase
MGMSTPGEIRRLTEIAPIDHGVIANIGIAHLENFPTGQKGIAEAKGEMIAGMKPGGAWVYPAEDDWCRWISAQPWAKGPKPVPVGKGADFAVALQKKMGLLGEAFSLETPMGKFDFEIKLHGRHQVQNAALAASIALIAGFDGDQIARGLAAVEPGEGRGRLHPISGGGWLLDESYNACQESIISCAKALLELEGGEPIAVLGCMRELGAASAAIHEATGKALAKSGIARIFVYGDFANEMADAFGQGASAYSDYEVLEPALAELPPGARILVKGSRHWKAERAVNRLLSQFGDDLQTNLNRKEA